ncbi:MAG: hypothetical protein NXY57DRAFT_345376 [Lentinula lateritia]|nr:MAG: hypothetical protein NXY57DRAFT_345376 [Lentinula lateritia]
MFRGSVATDFTRKMLKAKSMVPGNSGKNNLGIFTLPHEVSEFKSILGDETVLKLVDYNWEGSSCEVFALRKFAEFQTAKGQTPTFVTSGFVKFKDPPRKSGLVVMRKVPGMPLKGTKQWQEEGGQRQEMVDKVFKNIADFDYELIQVTGYVHVDFSSGNFLVDADMNIYPIDFGAPSMYPIERIPTRSEFDAWFLKRFDYIWHTQGGKLQLTHLISPKKTLT